MFRDKEPSIEAMSPEAKKLDNAVIGWLCNAEGVRNDTSIPDIEPAIKWMCPKHLELRPAMKVAMKAMVWIATLSWPSFLPVIRAFINVATRLLSVFFPFFPAAVLLSALAVGRFAWSVQEETVIAVALTLIPFLVMT